MSACDEIATFDDLIVGESDIFSFNFSDVLDDSEILSNPVITVSVINGVDLDPSALITGFPGLDASKKTVSVMLTGSVSGVTYCISAIADTNRGRQPIVAGRVKVIMGCIA